MATETSEPFQIPETSVGLVETQTATLFAPPHPLKTEGGSKLGPIQVAYETYGTLSPARDNVIFICHALTGDAHAAGYHENSNRKKPGWWEDFIGPGKGVDTDQYFVVCANVLGGCMGTTGPGAINPETGERYSLEFPVVAINDIVRVHHELLRTLGIDRVLAVVGGSLGGMQALEWAASYPNDVGAVIAIASAANVSAQSIAFNTVGRRAILADPQFQEGRFYGDQGPRYGLALARMLAHITYLSEASIEMKFGRRLQDTEKLTYNLLKETEFQIESYLHYQGRRFVERFDANSYLYLTKAMDYFNITESYGSLSDAWKDSTARFLIASYDTDWLFTTSQSKEIVTALNQTARHVSYIEFQSPYGHDSFLIECEQLAAAVRPFLAQTYSSFKLPEKNQKTN
ncbi:Homoserine O-acetyltransferase [Polystyrenella longa]|uniref:Homoserine O-acetyltransferase n=1 Tax=Polystyrenella longa TaxID=2528007 RepID=A0A518CP72_9PLAN|nr:homoserine O-acetyltransferase [Polystyrenella longa]QDU81020.1 Homoserine O-acetyltransferase [Polystyrenella longa]